MTSSRTLTLFLALFGLLASALAPVRAQESAPMTFRAVQIGDTSLCPEGCPAVIVARGQITQDTPAAFLDFLERNGGRDLHAVVFLDSPGGRVLASMEFGTLLRKVGAAAVVAGVYGDGEGGTIITNAKCYSACVYALMGARKRVIPSQSSVGIHRMFVYEESMAADGSALLRQRRYDNGDMRSFLMRYSADMGVSPGLIAAAERVPSNTLRILTPSEIRRWHLGQPRL